MRDLEEDSLRVGDADVMPEYSEDQPLAQKLFVSRISLKSTPQCNSGKS